MSFLKIVQNDKEIRNDAESVLKTFTPERTTPVEIRNTKLELPNYSGVKEFADKRGIFQGAGAADVLDVYDTTGGQTVGVAVTVNLDTTRYTSGTIFSLASDEITISEAAVCMVNFRVSCILAAGTRNGFGAHLEIDTGSGFGAVAGSYSYAYGREITVNAGTASGFAVINASAGDKIKIVADEQSTEDFLSTAGGSGLTIFKL